MTNSLFFPALGRLSLDNDLAILLVSRKHLCVQLELDALLGKDTLELLSRSG